jgi:hypothetical protein
MYKQLDMVAVVCQGERTTYNAANLGATVARQRANSRASILRARDAGLSITVTEHYTDGSRHDFEIA